MLTPYCQNVLKQELQQADYNGMAADAAWAWLMLPSSQSLTRAGPRLTPGLVAGLLGPAKAETIAAAIKAQFPTIGDHLLDEGVDATNQNTQAFLAALVQGGTLAQQDAQALAAAGTVTTTVTTPRRFDRRFDPALWPHVDADGNVTADATAPAIHGFPNDLGRADFDAAWRAAGRTP